MDIRDETIYKNKSKTDNTVDSDVGDVFMRSKQPVDVANKLDSKSERPFIIVKKLDKGVHVIKDPFDRTFVVSRKDLQLFDNHDIQEWKSFSKKKSMSCNDSIWKIRIPNARSG
jgi:hypothetical protein